MANDLTTYCAHAVGVRRQRLTVLASVAAVLLGAAPPAAAQFLQQGAKLVAGDATGTAEQGYAVALSAGGDTAIVGGRLDDIGNGTGAAYVFTRSNGVWSEQQKLVGTPQQSAQQGWSVALSADGNTALVGGPTDYSSGPRCTYGAAWVFTRSGGVWSQQAKLVGTNSSCEAQQGTSVALSADGSTAAIGGNDDEDGNGYPVGAVWLFTLSNGIWSQQGDKLVGSGGSEASNQGQSVALSADGNTLAVGGPFDGDPGGNPAGAVWVFTRSNGTWSQQGDKLVGSGAASASAEQGTAVALSADGNTLIEGGPNDNALWVFTRSDGTWNQQGSKLVGTGGFEPRQGYSVALSGDGNIAVEGGYDDSPNPNNGAYGAAWFFRRTNGAWSQYGSKRVGGGAVNGCCGALQGWSVAMSSDGSTAIEGGYQDNGTIGAAWVFAHYNATADSHDIDGNGAGDIVWSDSDGDYAIWLMSAAQMASGVSLGSVSGTSWSVVGTRNFDADGDADLLWLDGSGNLAIWLMNRTSVGSYNSLGNVGTAWQVAGTGDFNGDWVGDILWRNTSTGDLAIWLMSNGAFSSGIDLGAVPPNWAVAGTGDFNGDGTTDILWRNTSNGELAIWFMSNGQLSSSLNVGRVSTDWTVVGTGDFDGDGVADVLWRDSEGDLAIWLMNSSGQLASGTTFSGIPTTWSVAETGDFDGDGKSDILWIDQGGDLGVWLMNGLTVSSALGLGNVGTSWTVQGQNAD